MENSVRSFTAFKDHYGRWTAATRIQLDDHLTLDITTKKGDGLNLQTRATVSKLEGNFQIFRMGYGNGQGDFSKTLFATDCPRVTQAVIAKQHERIFETPGFLDELKGAIQKHYEVQKQASMNTEKVAENAL